MLEEQFSAETADEVITTRRIHRQKSLLCQGIDGHVTVKLYKWLQRALDQALKVVDAIMEMHYAS